MNNGKKINDFDLPGEHLRWFWEPVNASGLAPLLKTNYDKNDMFSQYRELRTNLQRQK
jgi:hypothetical protein